MPSPGRSRGWPQGSGPLSSQSLHSDPGKHEADDDEGECEPSCPEPLGTGQEAGDDAIGAVSEQQPRGQDE